MTLDLLDFMTLDLLAFCFDGILDLMAIWNWCQLGSHGILEDGILEDGILGFSNGYGICTCILQA